MTILDLITSSLKLLGVVAADDQPHENDANDALLVLNMLLDSWSLEGLTLYYPKNTIYNLVTGQQNYYIGPASQLITTSYSGFTSGTIAATVNGVTYTQQYVTSIATTLAYLAAQIKANSNIQSATYSASNCNHLITIVPREQPIVVTVNTVGVVGGLTAAVTAVAGIDFDGARPIKITHSFVRDTINVTYPIDWPVEIVPNDKYQQLDIKSLVSAYPVYLCYTPLMPAGLIRLWPVPNRTSLQLSLTTYAQHIIFSSLTSEFAMPPGYALAIRYNLAVQLANEYGADVSSIVRQAAETKATLMRINSEPVYASLDSAILQGGNTGRFNIISGL